DAVSPEILAGLIALPVKKVVILLTDKTARVIDRVTAWLSSIVGNLHRSRCREAQGRAPGRITEDDGQTLRPFCVIVFIDEHGNRLLRFAGSKHKSSRGINVIALLFSGAVNARVVHGRCGSDGARASHGNNDLGAVFLYRVGRQAELESGSRRRRW